jgi:hypothetical protein
MNRLLQIAGLNTSSAIGAAWVRFFFFYFFSTAKGAGGASA